MPCVQDGPLQAPSAILCLEGEKLLVLFDDLSDEEVGTIRARPPTVEHLTAMSKAFSGQLVTLRAGEGVFIHPGVWHVAVNLVFTVSINASMCAMPDVLDMLEDTYSFVHANSHFKLFGSQLMSGPMSEALSHDCAKVEAAFQQYQQGGSSAGAVAKDAYTRLDRWHCLVTNLNLHPYTFADRCSGIVKGMLKQTRGFLPYADHLRSLFP